MPSLINADLSVVLYPLEWLARIVGNMPFATVTRYISPLSQLLVFSWEQMNRNIIN